MNSSESVPRRGGWWSRKCRKRAVYVSCWELSAAVRRVWNRRRISCHLLLSGRQSRLRILMNSRSLSWRRSWINHTRRFLSSQRRRWGLNGRLLMTYGPRLTTVRLPAKRIIMPCMSPDGRKEQGGLSLLCSGRTDTNWFGVSFRGILRKFDLKKISPLSRLGVHMMLWKLSAIITRLSMFNLPTG